MFHTCMFPACCFCQRTYMAQNLVNGVLNSLLLTVSETASKSETYMYVTHM